ncbi:MAG: alanine racemase [Rhodocyclales bacterium]|nr:alanine racemase [Rhodocyclales bacterium]
MRPSCATIDLDALRANYLLAKRLANGHTLAVVKADAYGHGAIACAKALEPLADGFAVAFLEEAIPLRTAGIRSPIVLLEGAFDPGELEAAAELDLWPVVHHEAQLRMLEFAPRRPRRVWVKINSGINRTGFAPQQAAHVWRRLQALPDLEPPVWMTHFACADDPSSAMTLEQIRRFHGGVAALPGETSLANSAALLAWPQARGDWARPGILLYGGNPLLAGADPGEAASLQPVMHLTSKVFATRWLAPGEALGYGATFIAERPTRVGLVAIGYADGYPRHAPTGTPVAVGGWRTRLLGRVSMDMLTVDLTSLPEDVGLGAPVELWGQTVSVDEVARAAGTISYELLCRVKRVHRLHHGTTLTP